VDSGRDLRASRQLPARGRASYLGRSTAVSIGVPISIVGLNAALCLKMSVSVLPVERWVEKVCARCGRRFFAWSCGTAEQDARCYCTLGCFTHRHDRPEVARKLDA
jgi:hypothetical protein